MPYGPESRLDGKPVKKITAFLFDKGGHEDPIKLKANAGKSFQGSIVLGMGFTFDETNPKATPITEMHRLIEQEPRNAGRIFPYIGGDEVNSSPTHAHHRYVINFGEMLEREARQWPDLMQIVEEKVKPQRSKDNRASYRDRWWHFAEKQMGMQRAIQGLDRVLVTNAQASTHHTLIFYNPEVVFANSLNIFPFSNWHSFCLLQSRVHEIFARFLSSSMKDDLRYNPSDCFETFPFPSNWETNLTLESVGKEYYEFRAQLMVQNNQGLTDTYNRFHDPDERDPDILKLRELHEAMDRVVLDAYGWQDIPTTCEFRLDYEEEEEEQETTGRARQRKKPWRYKWPEEVHDEVLARLLALNQQRAEEEQLSGAGKEKKPKGSKKRRKASDQGPTLF